MIAEGQRNLRVEAVVSIEDQQPARPARDTDIGIGPLAPPFTDYSRLRCGVIFAVSRDWPLFGASERMHKPTASRILQCDFQKAHSLSAPISASSCALRMARPAIASMQLPRNFSTNFAE